MLGTIRQDDFINSIADALQYISYYHPRRLHHGARRGLRARESPAARDAIAQILTNSRMCAEGHRPVCQDTGIVVVFLKIGMDVPWDATLSVEDMVNEGVRRAYLQSGQRAARVDRCRPAGARKNTRDNTPAVIHTQHRARRHGRSELAAKGGGSENKAKFAMLNPSDDIVDWVLKTVPTMGAGWCPPGMLGIGIGGSAEKAMLLAKESLLDPIDMHELKARGPHNRIEELRIEIHDEVNALGIGAQGLGGLTTVLDVKILDYPTHAAVAAGRHHSQLRGHAPRALRPGWDGPGRVCPCRIQPTGRMFVWAPAPAARRVNLNTRHPRGHSRLEARRNAAAVWQAADRPGRRAQTHRRSVCQRSRLPARPRLHQPLHLLRRAGRSGPGRSCRSCRPDDRDAHGQVHGHDARADGTARHDRQGRARARGYRGDQASQVRLSHCRRRRRLPRLESDPFARSSPSRIWAWRPSTSSRSRTCR